MCEVASWDDLALTMAKKYFSLHLSTSAHLHYSFLELLAWATQVRGVGCSRSGWPEGRGGKPCGPVPICAPKYGCLWSPSGHLGSIPQPSLGLGSWRAHPMWPIRSPKKSTPESFFIFMWVFLASVFLLFELASFFKKVISYQILLKSLFKLFP